MFRRGPALVTCCVRLLCLTYGICVALQVGDLEFAGNGTPMHAETKLSVEELEAKLIDCERISMPSGLFKHAGMTRTSTE